VAARIAATTQGGEIVASAATLAEAGRAVPVAASEIALRGVQRPVTVARVEW
jgi:class 3 adenylate cyclase